MYLPQRFILEFMLTTCFDCLDTPMKSLWTNGAVQHPMVDDHRVFLSNQNMAEYHNALVIYGKLVNYYNHIITKLFFIINFLNPLLTCWVHFPMC